MGNDVYGDLGDALLPPDPELLPIHTRTYEIRAFKRSDEAILLRGAVRDLKPPGLYIDDDPDPLAIHHMIVELEVGFPSLEITAAEVVFETHPHSMCPSITEHYGKLVGLSIARGFTHKVRELFGGPRGCTHTTALLQAMAPVAVQCGWSMRVATAKELGDAPRPPMTLEQKQMLFASNLNTCHIWDEDGEHVRMLERGEMPEAPIQVSARLRELGRDPDEWLRRRG